MKLLCISVFVASWAVASSQDEAVDQPAAVELDDAGSPTFVEMETVDEETPKYDPEVEKQIGAANLTKAERVEVEATLDELLRRSNISAKKEKKQRKKATTTTTAATTTTKTTTTTASQATNPYTSASLVQEDTDSMEAGSDDKKPLSDDEITKALKQQTESEDPQVQALEKQHDNLTSIIKAEAKVVAETSANLSKNNEVQNINRAEVDQLGAIYERVHDEAEHAADAYKAHIVALAIAKKKRDDLKKQTDEARRYLEEVAPKYHAAEYRYSILMSQTPWLEGHANTSGEDETKRGKAFKLAGEKRTKLKAKISRDDQKLEAALAKLNSLNLELRKVEEKLGAKSFSLRACSPGVAQLLALFAVLSTSSWSLQREAI